MKFTQSLVLLAAAVGSATAEWNTTVTDMYSYTVTVPCSTGTGSVVVVPTSNGTYTKPTATATPSTVVTAGASSLDARVFVGAVAAVAAVAFTL